MGNGGWTWGDRGPALTAAREIVTLLKMAEEQGLDDEAHRGGTVREITKDWLPWQQNLLIEVLARSVAATYDDLDDWSASVLKAVAEEGPDE